MIFVTVGTAHNPFDRLLRTIDEVALLLGDAIVAQIGHASYEPKNYTWFRFTPHDQMLKEIEQASLVIAHGGFAIISECLRAGRPVLVVPRRLAVGEHVSDHQQELVDHLASMGYLDTVRTPEEVRRYLLSGRIPPTRAFNFETGIPEIVQQFIEEDRSD